MFKSKVLFQSIQNQVFGQKLQQISADYFYSPIALNNGTLCLSFRLLKIKK